MTTRVHPLVAIFSAASLLAGCDRHAPPNPLPTAPSTSPGAPSNPPPAAGPPRTISGVVQTVAGAPLSGVAIVPAFGGRYESDAAGAFSFSYPATTQPFPAYLQASAVGFETRTIGWGLGLEDVTLRPFALFARLEMLDDERRSASILPADPAWWVGEEYDSDLCSPCHRIHVAMRHSNDVRVRLSWSGAVSLQLWASYPGLSQPLTVQPLPDATSAELTIPSISGTLLHVGLNSLGNTPPLQAPIAYQLTLTPVQ